MRIVALDPGGTTGWTIYDTGDDIWQSGEFGPDAHHYPLWRFLRRAHAGAVEPSDFVLICERFDHRNAVAELISVEYIGIAKLFEQDNHVPLLLPASADMMMFGTNDKLEHLGILERPLKVKRHINDAKRHLVTYLCTKAPPNIRQPYLRRLKDLP